MLQESFLGSFDKLAVQPGNRNVHEIKSVLKKFENAEDFLQHLEEGYVRLFISDRGGVTAPLYESCYANIDGGAKALLMGPPAIDMQNRFESKGLSLSKDIHEPPDHISIELEYLYFLLAKGWSAGDKDMIDEASTFAADVMLPWVSAFQARLVAEKKFRFYPLMASLLTAILEIIAAFNRHIKSA
ncbi:MAG: molecular chaperone TorD family protein [Deltaproteobacteria bacterium]|nr:molecular chaperone TorD family protein [Deltaproteobacteria bacterium]